MRDTCPGCATPIGSPHVDGCDVARCMMTGGQRIQCDGQDHPEAIDLEGAVGEFLRWWDDPATFGSVIDHVAPLRQAYHSRDCGLDTWTGEWPGEDDARRLGLWCTDPTKGRMFPCSPDTPGAVPSLNRLMVEAVWDSKTGRWEAR